MARIDEINARLAAIDGEIDTTEGEAFTALETEAAELIAERSKIMEAIKARKQLRESIAAGHITGQIIEQEEEENPMEERKFTLESEEYRSAFLHHLRGEDMSDIERRAFTFLTSNTTAPLPTVMQNRIIDLIGEEHPIVADVYTLNSSANISIPVAKTLDADAAKTAEGADHADLQVTMDTVDLSGNDHTADVEMSYKMAAMAIDAFEDYLITLISGRLGALLASDIVANIKEQMNAANKIQTGVNYTNICAGFGELKRVGTVVVYGTRKGVYNKLVGMVDSNKRPIFMNAITEKAAGAILGATIKFEDAVGDNELLIGDPKKYLQNVVVPVMIEPDRVVKKSKLVYAGYTCQEGALTDDKAFALVAEAAG